MRMYSLKLHELQKKTANCIKANAEFGKIAYLNSLIRIWIGQNYKKYLFCIFRIEKKSKNIISRYILDFETQIFIVVPLYCLNNRSQVIKFMCFT